MEDSNLVSCTGFCVLAISLIVFKSAAKVIDHNRVKILSSLQSRQLSVRNWYRFNNLLISFAHSIISSVLALYSVFIYPKLCWDFVYEFHTYPFLLVSFSGGYFVADTWVNLERRKAFGRTWKDSAEIIVHHVLILSDLAIAFYRMKYLGGLITAILAEVNNIFLHLRSLLLLLYIPVGIRGNLWVTRLNVITSVLFRLVPLSLITYRFTIGLDDQYPDIPLLDHTFVMLSVFLLFVYKTAMLCKILKHDYKNSTD